MEFAILALLLAPSIIVFAAGCLLAMTRSWQPAGRGSLSSRTRGPAL